MPGGAEEDGRGVGVIKLGAAWDSGVWPRALPQGCVWEEGQVENWKGPWSLLETVN